MMRIMFWTLGCLAMAACGNTAETSPLPQTMLACALDGAADFAEECTVEGIDTESGREIIVRHPDGGFRRFVVRDDRSGVEAAAGADEAVNQVRGDKLEVALGRDRYLLPAALDTIGAPEEPVAEEEAE